MTIEYQTADATDCGHSIRRSDSRIAGGPRGLAVAIGLLLFSLIWLAQLTHSSLSPPADNIEQLTWTGALDWGYYKHPPLPTWLLWLAGQLFGVTAWTSYGLAAVMVFMSMVIIWRLLSSMRSREYATLALMAVLCITYYNGRLYFYNHNTVLLLISTASAALSWKAWSTGSPGWWAALGLAIGLGLITKYQIAVTVVCVVVFWLTQRGWRDTRQRSGILLAALVSLIVFVPHIEWLRTHDFAPIQYAMDTSLSMHLERGTRFAVAFNWILDQLLNRALLAWVLIAIAFGLADRRVTGGTAISPANVVADAKAGSRALLLTWGIVPLAFMPLMSIATGSQLQMPWGTAFLPFAVPAVMEIFGGQAKSRRLAWRSILIAFTAIQVCLLILNQLTSPFGPKNMRDQFWRSFDSQALADQLVKNVQIGSANPQPCVVAGPTDIAGVLALTLPNHPMVLVDERLDRSPWLTAAALNNCRVLHVGRGIPEAGGLMVGAQFPDVWWRVSAPGAARVVLPVQAHTHWTR